MFASWLVSEAEPVLSSLQHPSHMCTREKGNSDKESVVILLLSLLSEVPW